MAAEVTENHDSLVKELETLKSRLEEERLKLNDVARKLNLKKQLYFGESKFLIHLSL